jgi:hypothetical protein
MPRYSWRLNDKHLTLDYHLRSSTNIATMPLDLRSMNYDYMTRPLWSQILLPLGCLTLWIPLYFFVELIAEWSYWARRNDTVIDVENQSSQQKVKVTELRTTQANAVALAF